MSKNNTAQILTCSVVLAFAVGEAPAADGNPWRVYSEEANGDVYFFDTSRVERTSDLQIVWQRIRYKRSVMGASSYQSLLEVDCSGRTEQILQRTFFSDKHWEERAMNTDVKEKPKRPILEGSPAARLAEALCDP